MRRFKYFFTPGFYLAVTRRISIGHKRHAVLHRDIDRLVLGGPSSTITTPTFPFRISTPLGTSGSVDATEPVLDETGTDSDTHGVGGREKFGNTIR